MANKLYEENDIQNIADAIRSKNGSSDKYTTSQMASAIMNISVSEDSNTPSGDIKISENGTFDVTAYARAIVNVINSDGSGNISGLPNCIKTGTFTVDEDKKTTNPITVTHNIGSTPTCVFVAMDETSTIDVNATVMSIGVTGGRQYFYKVGSGITYSANGGVKDVNEITFTFTACADVYPVKAGYTYRWFAWV